MPLESEPSSASYRTSEISFWAWIFCSCDTLLSLSAIAIPKESNLSPSRTAACGALSSLSRARVSISLAVSAGVFLLALLLVLALVLGVRAGVAAAA